MKNRETIAELLCTPVKSNTVSEDKSFSPKKKMKSTPTSAEKNSYEDFGEVEVIPPPVCSINPPFPMVEAIDPVTQKKTVGIAACLPVGLKKFSVSFVNSKGNKIYTQEGASRVIFEADWPIEAYDPKVLFGEEIEEGEMTTEHPMYLKWKSEKFERDMSFGAPKWRVYFDLPFKVKNDPSSYTLKVKKHLSKLNSTCVFVKFIAYEADHIFRGNDNILDLD